MSKTNTDFGKQFRAQWESILHLLSLVLPFPTVIIELVKSYERVFCGRKVYEWEADGPDLVVLSDMVVMSHRNDKCDILSLEGKSLASFQNDIFFKDALVCENQKFTVGGLRVSYENFVWSPFVPKHLPLFLQNGFYTEAASRMSELNNVELAGVLSLDTGEYNEIDLDTLSNESPHSHYPWHHADVIGDLVFIQQDQLRLFWLSVATSPLQLHKFVLPQTSSQKDEVYCSLYCTSTGKLVVLSGCHVTVYE